METRELKIIQVIAKTGRILSKVVMILCIVGACGCMTGLLTFNLIPATMELGGIPIHSMIEKTSGRSIDTIYFEMATGMFLCIGEAVLAGFAAKYFTHEIAAGTPFTMDGARELFRLGLLTIIIPSAIYGTIVAVGNIITMATNAVSLAETADFPGICLGIGLLFLSVVFRYGAVLREKLIAPDDERGAISE